MHNPEKIIKKINILVVDDMETMRSMVNSCLKELGAERVLMECNGESAWKALKSTRIDLIICDWDMPELSGLELLNRIRGSERHSHIPFLMLTASTEKEKVTSAVKAGVNDYLAKPFQPKELEYRIIKLLRKVKIG
ncbi:response regulator [Teredinibacter haidensis]|uniref:response regulator n=1 Tax=Teredinibacter haidensis TaxID=2731755 RepID=UPI00094905CC|nr:response regulator [Teredinibacter haidensis]